MTASADLAEVCAALALVAQATPGAWSSAPAPTSPAGGLLVFDVASCGRPIATTCGDTDETIEEAERNAAAIVALRNAAPAIAAAVEELTAARAAIAALHRQVCRLTSGDEIEGDRLCQHHGADVAALALLSDERAAHAETLCELDALLTALGAQVTPGGQTEDACHARRVADGMRRARELVAAREVPPDVEAAIRAAIDGAVASGEARALGHASLLTGEPFYTEPRLRAAIAKAIADAEERGRADSAAAPHDVEVAISDLVAASRDLEVYAAGKVTAKRTKSAEAEFGRSRTALRAAIAAEIERGRATARAEFDHSRSVFFNDMLRRRDVKSPCQECDGHGVVAYPSTATWHRGAGGQMSTYDVCSRCWGSGDEVKRGVDLRRLGAEIERARVEGRAETPAAPATVARPISEWHDDIGSALWWRFPVEEPPYSGTPLDSDWPGYHTHWTPIVCPDDPATRGPIGAPNQHPDGFHTADATEPTP